MAGSSVGDPPLTRAESREEFDWLRGELFRHCATKADSADLRAWLVGASLAVLLNSIGTVGVIVAVVLT